MKRQMKITLSLLLSVLMIFSAFAAFHASAVQTEFSTTSANLYGLTEKISDGAILHAWCWSFNAIRENLQKIAEAGFTSVQTSPINQCKVGENGGMELYGNGKWYYHYQPTLYTIGNYQLGTLEEFKSLCSEADKYGIKILVDVVANHCSSDYSVISAEIKNIPGGAFHENMGISDWGNRYQCTQGWLLGLYDLNTQNTNVQQMILNYLKKCVAAGADGFRYDAAKHIELPDDQPVDGHDFASDFWPVILNNGSEFQYGEILQGSGSRTADYANYMSVTASDYGGTLRNAAQSGSFSANDLNDYRSGGAPAEKLVTWVESHDNYTGDGSWSQLDNQDIRQAWAVISARGDTTPLFFSRPDGSSTSNQWGKNKIGIAGDDNYCHSEVAAVNQFRNAMVGLPNKLSNPTGDSSLLMIERGSAGAVIINASDNDITMDFATDVADGSYTDQATGAPVTVSGGKISGTVKAGAVAVIYNSGLVKQPTVSLSQDSGQFRGALTLTLSARNTTEATYKISNNAPVKYVSGDTITIGADMAENTSVDITLYGKNDDGEVTKTYAFTKISSPVMEGETVVYFDNADYNWGEVYIYAYYRDENGNTVKKAEWPGEKMTDLGGGMYGYAIDESWSTAVSVLFNNNNGTQYPGHDEPGYEIKKGGSKIFSGSGLVDYIVEVPVTQPTAEPTTAVPTTEPTAEPTTAVPTTEPTAEPTTAVPATEPTAEPTTAVPTTEPPTTEPPVITIEGDVNGDGELNVKDAAAIQLKLARLYTGVYIESAADINGDGEINVKDAAYIQLKLAKLL